ncbi:permease for cytosine/purines, uracil, thiamine, allantoin-domain-containing protein [Irpex rosettiformis]|uniref:Permease for cytosine/purines, uracil, thiamine, allantoin-domain-containing protein n=1 Tax=Irpex rosettiformis TaxID=378272 RepID=A0ACB8U1N2_9APHY|nr:permease for cytosine/purines, uracil, thiamine, allantoin-domain-containing protein [Irpex rosettiformis]
MYEERTNRYTWIVRSAATFYLPAFIVSQRRPRVRVYAMNSERGGTSSTNDLEEKKIPEGLGHNTAVTLCETPKEGGSSFVAASLATLGRLKLLTQKAVSWLANTGLEQHGITPIPESQRTDPRLYQIFTTWFAANANIITFGAGSVGPAAFGLGMKDSFLIIVVVDIIMCIPPSIFTVFGPKLGTRAMVQSRFSWGYYGAILPSIFNVLSVQSYLIINCIIGGQTLASVSPHLNSTTGIVITGLMSLVLTFGGYQTLHWYEMLSWAPNVITFIVMLGVSGSALFSVPTSGSVPATAASILTFASTLAVSVISWCPIVSDYGIFHDAKASSTRIFIYAYLGFLLGSVPAHLIGAAFTAAAPYITSWDEGLNSVNNIGGLVAAVLQPVGGFGKFLLVLLALTTPTGGALSMYTACTSFMAIGPAIARVPRILFALMSTAMLHWLLDRTIPRHRPCRTLLHPSRLLESLFSIGSMERPSPSKPRSGLCRDLHIPDLDCPYCHVHVTGLVDWTCGQSRDG